MLARRKPEQVTFLHAYHHGTMFVIWWIGAKFVAGGQSISPIIVNSFVHIIMYTYYLLAALGISVWWKRYITQLQLAQFWTMVMCPIISLYVECDFPVWMHAALIAYMFSMIALFWNFYRTTYTAKAGRKHAHTAPSNHQAANGVSDRKAKLA